jgi:hypothetical protein
MDCKNTVFYSLLQHSVHFFGQILGKLHNLFAHS